MLTKDPPLFVNVFELPLNLAKDAIHSSYGFCNLHKKFGLIQTYLQGAAAVLYVEHDDFWNSSQNQNTAQFSKLSNGNFHDLVWPSSSDLHIFSC